MGGLKRGLVKRMKDKRCKKVSGGAGLRDRDREPLNEHDAEQMAAVRLGVEDIAPDDKRILRTRDLAGPPREEGEASPLGFYVGEVFTIKGRRFKVAYVAGEDAVTLEPMGNFRVFERRRSRGMKNEVNRRN